MRTARPNAARAAEVANFFNTMGAPRLFWTSSWPHHEACHGRVWHCPPFSSQWQADVRETHTSYHTSDEITHHIGYAFIPIIKVQRWESIHHPRTVFRWNTVVGPSPLHRTWHLHLQLLNRKTCHPHLIKNSNFYPLLQVRIKKKTRTLSPSFLFHPYTHPTQPTRDQMTISAKKVGAQTGEGEEYS